MNEEMANTNRRDILRFGSASLALAPLRDTEEPIVRPYFLVEDIEASVSTAADSGAEIALPPTELPGYGRCASDECEALAAQIAA